MNRASNRENDGRRFEKLFQNVVTQYRYKNVMRLEKADPPTRVVGPGRIIYLENPFADFLGSWTERGGRAIFIEAKSTSDDQLKLNGSNLTDKQIDWLIHWHHAGAAVGVVWESMNRVGFLPIGLIDSIRRSGRRHIKFEEADPVPQGMGLIIFDFVFNLRKWYPAGSDNPGELAARPY